MSGIRRGFWIDFQAIERMRKPLVSNSIAIPFSLLYAALILWVPWAELRGTEFVDIFNYLRRIEYIRLYSLDGIDFGDSIISMMSSEFAWSWITSVFLRLGFTGEEFLAIMSGFSASVAAWFLARRVGGIAAVIMLINPISIDLYASQIRSAVAFSIFLLAASFIGNGTLKRAGSLALMVFTFFIHASMPVLLGVYAASHFIGSRLSWSPRRRVVITVSMAIAMALVFVVVAPIIINAIGDRRNLTAEGSKSIAYVAFWLILAGLLAISYNPRNTTLWTYFFGLIILIFVVLSELMNTPLFRFIALSIPVILSCLPDLSRFNRPIIFLLWPLYDILLFSYWLRG